MLAYLNAENAYADALMAPLKPLQDKLYEEIVGRIKQDDSSVPYRERGYWYYTRFETGQDYPIHARRKGTMEGAGGNPARRQRDGQGQRLFQRRRMEVSQDNQLLAWAEDAVGRRQYVVRIKQPGDRRNLSRQDHRRARRTWSGPTTTRRCSTSENDPETLLTRAHQEARAGHAGQQGRAGVRGEGRQLLHGHLAHARRQVHLHRHGQHGVSGEARCAPASDPAAFAVLAPRERDVEYDVDHLGGRWVIRTNADGAENFKLMTAPDGATSRADWKEWVAHRDDVFIEDFELFDGFTAIAERSDALERIRLVDAGGQGGLRQGRRVRVLDGACETNSEPDTDWLRYDYTSMTTPATTYELNTQDRRAPPAQAAAGARLRPVEVHHRAPVGDRARRHQDPGVAGLQEGLREERQGRTAAVRLRQLRPFDRPDLQPDHRQPARPRHGLRHRPHPRRPGNGPQVVRRRQAVPQEEHLHRLHRRHRFPGQGRLCGEGSRRRLRRQRRRPADGRDRQHGAADTIA